MKSTLHILAKDLRRFWPLILAAVAVNVLGYCVAFSNLEGTRALSGLGMIAVRAMQQAPLARWAIVFLLSVWVVLEDRGVGDRVAWMTRPFSAWELAAAKFLFLVLGVALPAGLVGTGLALWLKASFTAALATGLSHGLLALFVASVFASIAVVCASTGRAVLLTAMIFGGLALLAFVLFEVLHVTLPETPRGVSDGSSFLVFTGIGTISAMGILILQYATRRTRRTLLLAPALVVGIWVLGHWWPVSIWPPLIVSASVSPTPAGQLKFTVGTSDASFGTVERVFDLPRAKILAPLRLEGSSPDRTFGVGKVTSSLAMESGARISTAQWLDNPDIEDHLAAAAALGFSTPGVSAMRQISVAECPLEQFKLLQGQTGRLEAKIELVERRYEITARLPVQVGREVRINGRRSRLLSAQMVNGTVDVGIQFAEINPILGTRSRVWPNRYVLVNDKRSEFSLGDNVNVAIIGGPNMSFVTTHAHFAEARSQKTSQVTGRIDAAWLAQAELFFLVGRDVDAPPLLLPLTIEKFTIPVKQATRHIIVINPDGTRREFDQ